MNSVAKVIEIVEDAIGKTLGTAIGTAVGAAVGGGWGAIICAAAGFLVGAFIDWITADNPDHNGNCKTGDVFWRGPLCRTTSGLAY